jgi:uncharacterized protein (DUF58 family)
MIIVAIFAALLLVLFVIRRAYNLACLENVDVELSMSAAVATEGDELVLTEVVTNRKWLPLPWFGVKFQVDRELDFADKSAAMVSDLYYRHDLFHILMHQKITRRLAFTCAKRGYYAIRGLEVAGWDILMETKYIKQFEVDTRLTVYPSTLETAESDALCTRVYGHMRTVFPIHPDPFSFRGIREYSPSDPMKAINFKASAKTQDLMVNIWDFSNARQIVILLDLERRTIWHDENAEERAIKIAATIAERMNMQGVPITFYTNGRSIKNNATTCIPEGKGSVHLRKILEALAYLHLDAADVPPFAATLENLSDTTPEYWLISPYYSKETSAALAALTSRGARTAHLMPGERPLDFEGEEEIIFV